ncbi:hypothetical protein MNBD_DELTA01-697 [hydrothermal vent metagenome]|uniref:Universal stress protein n=1 Tax=hydrothermal vent metagenome TaxID=652676 RepID=A0A3B0QS23_9ZZZZ
MPDNTCKNILLCLDNSEDSRTATKLALRLAGTEEMTITGLHVYAAALHTERFHQLESYLPERYQNKEALDEQRSAHTTLITKGLEIISDSYMAPLTALGLEQGVRTKTVKREGKNYREILDEAKIGYGLVVLGARGLGTLNTPEEDGCGSVAERVARGIRADLLIVRTTARDDEDEADEISVAIDGSPESYGALLVAIGLAKKLDKKIKAIAAFDPLYHQVAFQSLEGVLSEADGELFKLEEQEKLHTEIIDNNLAALYQDHLDTAVAVAKDAGIDIDSELLSGKPYSELIKYARGKSPFMIIMGKTGVHADQGLEIGSATEKTLRGAPCSIYITTSTYTPPPRSDKDLPDISWNPEAEETVSRIPAFARAMVRKMAEETATEKGTDTVTRELLLELRKRIGL